MYTEVKFDVKPKQDSEFTEKVPMVEMGQEGKCPFFLKQNSKKEVNLCFSYIFIN